MTVTEIDELKATRDTLLMALIKIAGFAPGNGDVCEIIARIARDAMKDIDKATLDKCYDATQT